MRGVATGCKYFLGNQGVWRLRSLCPLHGARLFLPPRAAVRGAERADEGPLLTGPAKAKDALRPLASHCPLPREERGSPGVIGLWPIRTSSWARSSSPSAALPGG